MELMRTCLLLFFSVTTLSAWSQQQDTSLQTPASDSSTQRFYNTMKKAGYVEAMRNFERYKETRLSIKQNNTIEAIKRATEAVKIYLKNGIDTSEIENELLTTHSSMLVVRDGVFVNKGGTQTSRNLTVSSSIIEELLKTMVREKKKLDDFAADLVVYRDRIDSLSSDTSLFSFPSDSAMLPQYVQKIVVIARELRPIDSTLDQALFNVRDLQNRVDLMVFELRSASEDVEILRRDLSKKLLSQELPKIYEDAQYSRPFREILEFSEAKERMAFGFYSRDHFGALAIMFLLILVGTWFLTTLKKQLTPDKLSDFDNKEPLSMRYPALTAIVIVVSLFQFAFTSPPFLLSFFMWTLSTVSLAIIFRNFITKKWFSFWSIVVPLFILVCLDNLILHASRIERWFMAVLAFIGMCFGAFVLLTGRRRELVERRIVFFIWFLMIFSAASFFLNVFGWYNLAKALLVTGSVGVVVAVLLLWTVRLINESLRLASRVYKQPVRHLLYLNFEKVGEKVPRVFYVLLVLGWFVVVARNFYFYKKISDPFNEFLTGQRTIGKYTFTINSIFVFVLILICSVYLSRIISFFASESHGGTTAANKSQKKVTAGSWILLVRIFIISIGLFLAFAAAGIPLDKITIIIGALGVGIGLGLQGLVNNLVSGLIIAFEKPVNVGDIIEIGGQTGVMKSIGFRSSIVSMFDGSSTIIPNGDILSQHLVNWTTGKNIKRVKIEIGVAYGTDLQRVKQIVVDEILENKDRILKYPRPLLVAKNFGHSSIDFDIFFWAHFDDGMVLKSEVILDINEAFKKEGIVIPFPQQDLYIRAVPESLGDREKAEELTEKNKSAT